MTVVYTVHYIRKNDSNPEGSNLDFLAITSWNLHFRLGKEIKKAYRLVAMQCHPDKGELGSKDSNACHMTCKWKLDRK